MTNQSVKFYQVGSRAVGNRLLPADLRTEQAQPDRRNSLTSGHRACQGCGEALAARYVLDTAYRAAKGRLVAVNATGCLEVFSTPYPESSWQLPWLHSLFANAASVAAGVAAAMRTTGSDVRVLAQGGDGGTVDIGMACLSGMFERNDDVLYVCYDNEAYMNTGVQRSGATPPGGPHRDNRSHRRTSGQRLRHRQGHAAHRHGPRDPLRRHRHRRGTARPRSQGRDGDVDARCALPAHPRPVPARLGIGPSRHRQPGAPGPTQRPVPGLRSRARRRHRGHAHP